MRLLYGLVARFGLRVWRRLPLNVQWVFNRVINRTFLVGLIAVVFRDDGEKEVLIVQHTYRPEFNLGLPSGWLRWRESFADAMTREISEETGFEVRFSRVLRTEVSPRLGQLNVWLELSFVGGTFSPSAEVASAGFYKLAELPPILPEHRATLLELWTGSPPR